ncbi:MAG TPA: DUF2878 domain-containing protein [Xanthomonadaceae bacterium]|jgi:hypothetical protein|nr:DUF2878 domain-containing protein [Xanthomonadaceae bacterium]
MALGFAVANLLGFQVVWFAAVIGASNGHAWAGPVAALAFGIAHFAYTPDRRGDARLLAFALAMGVAADSALVLAGLLTFVSPWPWASLAPAWILAMWAGFALTLNHSMAFLRGRPAAAAVFGLVGGPLAYWGAARGWDAVSFDAGLAPAMLALAVVWGIALPALYALHGTAARAYRAHGARA